MSTEDLIPPNICLCCGARGGITDSRDKDNYRRRRYTCPTCGNGWRTYEWRQVDERLADRLLAELRQQTLKTVTTLENLLISSLKESATFCKLFKK